jgi:hypothetical protein
MKRLALLLALMASTLLSGCIVVPVHRGYYHHDGYYRDGGYDRGYSHEGYGPR